MKIGICGGTGLIGQALAQKLLERGDEVSIYSRSGQVPTKLKIFPKLKMIKTSIPTPPELEGIDVLINLVGEPVVSGRWTMEHKKKLWTSRVDYTRQLVFHLQKVKKRPSTFLSASAIGYYGMLSGDQTLLENSPSGNDFLAELSREWEKEAIVAKELGIRVIIPRIGVVLSRDGGALAQMLPAFQFFVGGPLGKGTQIMSWVHAEDLVNGFIFLMDRSDLNGVFNFTAPNPVSNEIFSKTLGKVIGRPSFLKAPSFAVQALFGEGADVVLKGQNVFPKKLLDSGFSFKYPELEGALQNLLK
jgi:uncharacterized protein (TIGR01777 family)